MNLNEQFELIRQSPTVSQSDRINALKASGRKIVGLQVGDPDFNTHPSVIVALQAMQRINPLWPRHRNRGIAKGRCCKTCVMKV